MAPPVDPLVSGNGHVTLLGVVSCAAKAALRYETQGDIPSRADRWCRGRDQLRGLGSTSIETPKRNHAILTIRENEKPCCGDALAKPD